MPQPRAVQRLYFYIINMKYTLQVKEPGGTTWADFNELCQPWCDQCTAWVTDCDPAFGQTYSPLAAQCASGSDATPVQNDWSDDGKPNANTATMTDKCNYLNESGDLRVYEAAAGRRSMPQPPPMARPLSPNAAANSH